MALIYPSLPLHTHTHTHTRTVSDLLFSRSDKRLKGKLERGAGVLLALAAKWIKHTTLGGRHQREDVCVCVRETNE